MATIFICGYGGWSLQDGFTVVPKGTTIKFYTQGGKALQSSDINLLILGRYAGQPSSELGPYRSCSNMRLYPCSQINKASFGRYAASKGVGIYFAENSNGILLSQIFEKYQGNNLVWACYSPSTPDQKTTQATLADISRQMHDIRMAVSRSSSISRTATVINQTVNAMLKP